MSVLSALVVWNSNHVVDGWSRRWCEAIKKYRPNICVYIYLSIYPPNTKWGYAWKPPQQTAVGSLPVFYSLLFHDDFLIPLKGQNQLTARPDVSLKKSMDELIEVKKALDINVYAGCVGVWTDMYDIFKGLGMIPPSKETWAHPFEFQTWKLFGIVISFKALVEPLTKVTFATDGKHRYRKHCHWWLLGLGAAKCWGGSRAKICCCSVWVPCLGLGIAYFVWACAILGWGSAYFMWCWALACFRKGLENGNVLEPKRMLFWHWAMLCANCGEFNGEKVYTLWTCGWVCCWRACARFQPQFLSSNRLPVEVRFCKPRQTNTDKRIFALHRAQEVLCILSILSAAPSQHSAKHLLWTSHPRM